METRISKALIRVENARKAFLDSKADRYSDEYYRLLTVWDNELSNINAQTRLQMAEVMNRMN